MRGGTYPGSFERNKCSVGKRDSVVVPENERRATLFISFALSSP